MFLILNELLYKAYSFLFKEAPSENAKKFIKNFNVVAVGFGASAVFGFISQIVLGRALGPSGYGKYALIQSVGMFLFIPMNLGVSSGLIKYNAVENERAVQKKIISSAVLLYLFFSSLLVVLFLLFWRQLSKIFFIQNDIIIFSIFFAIFYSLFSIAIDALKSLHKMKELSLFQFIDGLLMMVFLLFLYIYDILSVTTSVFAVYITFFVIFIAIFINIREYLTFKFDIIFAKKIVKYGLYATIGFLSYIFLMNFNKILINKYLLTSDVGVYNAYYFASTGVLSIFLGIFTSVFFPTASRQKNKEGIFKKIDKFLIWLLLLGTPVFFLIEFVILKLYGNKYPIDIYLMAEFAITGVMIIAYNFYDYLFASEGMVGIKIVALSGVTIAVINMILGLYLIPAFKLNGAIISLLASYLTGICMYAFLRKKIILRN